MARELAEAIEQAQPVPNEHRHLLERLLEQDDGGSAGAVAASVNSTELPALVTSRDGSGSTAASRYETVVCFWRSWGKVCYYL
jgi:putative heme iron utilization protein